MPEYTIGFDIGGTYLRGVLWNGKRVVRSAVYKTPHTKTAFVRTLKRAIHKLTPARESLRGVGIGIAGVISGTKLLRGRNLKALEGLNLRPIVPRHLKLKVDNDARVFLWGQPGLSTRYKMKRVLGITLGTGIGRALAVDGKIKLIEPFEHQELWESEYQRRRFEPSKDFAAFLATHIVPLIKHYQPNIVLIGGGVLQQKVGLKRELRASFSRLKRNVAIKYVTIDRLQAARGAATLVFKV